MRFYKFLLILVTPKSHLNKSNKKLNKIAFYKHIHILVNPKSHLNKSNKK